MSRAEFIPAGADAPVIDTGTAALQFWRAHVMKLPQFNSDKEWTTVLLLDAQQRLLGHLPVESDGANGSVQTHEIRRVLRAMLLADAAGTTVLHNHPPGSLDPSDNDCRGVNTWARWMDIIGLRFFDFVIFSHDGSESYSFAETGQLTVRAAVIQETQYKTRLEGFSLALECLCEHAPWIGPVITECAVNAGVSREQWLADFMYEDLVRHFSPEPTEDRRFALIAEVHRRNPAAYFALVDAARQQGVGISQFAWQKAVAALVEAEKPSVPGGDRDAA